MREELLAKLQKIDSSLIPAPWSVEALYSGIRHLQRNTEVMEEAQEYADESDKSANLPGRYDGENLAVLRNLLPEIIAALAEK